MEFKIILTYPSIMTMKKRGGLQEEVLDFITVKEGEDEDSAIIIDGEGESDKENAFHIVLSKKQAKRLANNILSFIEED